MSDTEKTFDNSWQAVWKRELNEILEELKYPERYSAAQIAHKQLRKKELEKALSANKKNAFATGQENVKNKANTNTALSAQMFGGQGIE